MSATLISGVVLFYLLAGCAAMKAPTPVSEAPQAPAMAEVAVPAAPTSVGAPKLEVVQVEPPAVEPPSAAVTTQPETAAPVAAMPAETVPPVAAKAEAPAAPVVAKPQAPAVPVAAKPAATASPQTKAAPPKVAKNPPAVAPAKQSSAAVGSTSRSTASIPAAAPAATDAVQKKDVAAPQVAKPAAAAPMDLTVLEKRLRDTNAIGMMTKITIKNQVDELLDRFRAHYDGRSKTSLEQLRQPYDTLIMKVLSLLQDKDPSLASSIVASREAIWSILADPTRFSNL